MPSYASSSSPGARRSPARVGLGVTFLCFPLWALAEAEPDVEQLAAYPVDVTLAETGKYYFPVWRIGDSQALWAGCREQGFAHPSWAERYRLSKDGGRTWVPLTQADSRGCQFQWLISFTRTVTGSGPAAAETPAAGALAGLGKKGAAKPWDADVGIRGLGDSKVVEFTGQYLANPDLGFHLGLYAGEDLYGGALTASTRNLFSIKGLDLTLTGGYGQSQQEANLGSVYGKRDVDMQQSSAGVLMQYQSLPGGPLATALQALAFRYASNDSGGGGQTFRSLVQTPTGPELNTATFDLEGGTQSKGEFAALSPGGFSASLSQHRLEYKGTSSGDLDSGLISSLGYHQGLAKGLADMDAELGYAAKADQVVYDLMLTTPLLGTPAGFRLSDDSVVARQSIFIDIGHCGFEIFNQKYDSQSSDSGAGFYCSLNKSQRTKSSGLGPQLATDLRRSLEHPGGRIAEPVRGADIQSLQEAATRVVVAEKKREQITQLNDRPQARITGLPAEASAGATLVADGSTSSDPNGSIQAYAWSVTGSCSLSGAANGVTVAIQINPNAAAGESCGVQLQVRDNQGATDATSTSVRINPPPNQPPRALISGVPAQTQAGAEFTASGSGSNDPDGRITAYLWTASGECALVGAATGSSAQYQISPNATPGANCVVGLTVTDDRGATGSATAIASINAAPNLNQPPVARINRVPPEVRANQRFVAEGSSSSDPDGQITGFQWSALGACSLVGSSTGTTAQYVMSANAQAGASCQVTLVVTDNQGATGTASVTASVANQPPIARITEVPRSATGGQSFIANGSTSSDPDGQIVAYLWSALGSCSIIGDATSATAQLRMNFSATGAAGPCNIGLTVTDNLGATSSASAQSISNQAPIANIIAPIEVPYGEDFGASGSGSFDPDGQIVSYQWTRSGPCQFFDSTTDQVVILVVDLPPSPPPPGQTCNLELTVTDNLGATGSASYGVSLVSF